MNSNLKHIMQKMTSRTTIARELAFDDARMKCLACGLWPASSHPRDKVRFADQWLDQDQIASVNYHKHAHKFLRAAKILYRIRIGM